MPNYTVPPDPADTSWDSPYSIPVQIVVWIIIIVLSLETIIGNAMVVMAYRIERNISKQVSNRYIVSLAISDLIIGIEGFPFFTVYVLNGDRWPLGWVACQTWLFLDYTLCLVSILTVLLITADRYLSVCHTAKYLKWQSPTKTQLLIVMSWLLPAIIFGIMIYGWQAMTGQSTSMSGAECSAPFLSNPYVNMGMYVAYYWTTLVAMLILYKGIHQAAKNLEKKAKAKERRHIALILSQRLGTQVGVSLMLQSKAEKEKAEEAQKDSGYTSNQAGGSLNTENDQNLGVIEEERSGFLSRRESNESYYPGPHPTAANSRRCSEMEKVSLLSESDGVPSTRPAKSYGRLSLRSRYSASESITTTHENDEKEVEKADSLQKLFADDELGSVLNFKEEKLKNTDSNNDSDTTSVILQRSRKYKKNKRPRSSRRSEHSTPRQIAKVKQAEGTAAQLIEESVPDDDQTETIEVKRTDRWVVSMKKRIARALIRRRSTTRPERGSSSNSDDSSSEVEGEEKPEVRNNGLKIPQLTVNNENRGETSSQPGRDRLAPPNKTDTFLSASGVSRKISTISTVITREKVISSIFAPIAVFNRGRKQTKAEKRAHKAFRTITFIVGFFAILWSPYYIMATVYGFCKGECIPSFLYTLSYYMCYLNSSGNPFAYALANRQFRSAFMRMFRGNFNKVA
ncbi:putative muscarinic acetylcholine receptor gar-1 [Caenorhabditis elegans]|uniref:Isoform A of Probable muscarinic acetylcholine receptor gar-1 n=1 Tax=Caenorhabditis elegans TaxID=6239 RepID=Q18007-2|nr:putative muscarinic acetylcholine receptor gar-1 [Caenorhabditis elegans]AAD13747.1 G protein-linked acetylcholine receptor GAR-1b [Caenorhabditis elegans]CCD64566.1 Probable muscarinic acetylcholine receptor gar-1 [Caenorhabditis elegans]|eukprot:NP_001024401.1 Probable muscarinic acetylcholine receptor gar-1 [Caenorhabditis elegans]